MTVKSFLIIQKVNSSCFSIYQRILRKKYHNLHKNIKQHKLFLTLIIINDFFKQQIIILKRFLQFHLKLKTGVFTAENSDLSLLICVWLYFELGLACFLFLFPVFWFCFLGNSVCDWFMHMCLVSLISLLLCTYTYMFVLFMVWSYLCMPVALLVSNDACFALSLLLTAAHRSCSSHPCCKPTMTSFAITGIKYILKYINTQKKSNCKNNSQYYCFYCIFWSNNAAVRETALKD